MNRMTTTFRPDRGNVIAAALMAGIFIIVIGYAPLYLFWLLALPILFLVWIFRARTEVSEDGMRIQPGFGSSTQLKWGEIEGVGFKKSKTYLRTTSGKEHPLPGVTFNTIPALSEASRGRIPDVVTAGKKWADGKVEVVNRDGNRVLLTREEYEEYQATHPVAETETMLDDDSSESSKN